MGQPVRVPHIIVTDISALDALEHVNMFQNLARYKAWEKQTGVSGATTVSISSLHLDLLLALAMFGGFKDIFTFLSVFE